MAAISTWSTSAASNNSASPDGFPEGMAPSGVNDSAREVMASVRTWYDDMEWRVWGHTISYASATTFTTAAGDGDTTAIYVAGRRVRAVGSSTGTIYGIITGSSHSSVTTVTVRWDSGSLANEALTISLGQTPTGNALGFDADGAEVVWNEPGADVNFRIETSGGTHTLYLDGGNDRIGIGESAPGADLHITNTAGGNALTVESSSAATTSDVGVAVLLASTDTTPVDGGLITRISSSALHDGSVTSQAAQVFGYIGWVADDVTEDSEDGHTSIFNIVGGSLAEDMRLSGSKVTTPRDMKIGGAIGDTPAARLEVSDSSTGDVAVIKSTAAVSAVAGPILVLHRDATGDATEDYQGRIVYRADDSGGTATDIGIISIRTSDLTDTTETSRFEISTIRSGSLAVRLTLGAGVWLQGATDGDKGAGTFNAVKYYANGNEGVSFSGAITNLTVVNGIVTAAS